MTTQNAKITKILQNRLMKLQKFESKLILSQISQKKASNLITEASYHHLYYTILNSKTDLGHRKQAYKNWTLTN